MTKYTTPTRCPECQSVLCHRLDCETGKREKAARALDQPPMDKMVKRPMLKK